MTALLLSCLTILPGEAADDRYRLLIAIRAADHPLLTPAFVSGVRRQVADQLTNYFGPLADVDVRTSEHWLLDKYRRAEVSEPEVNRKVLAEHQFNQKAFLVRIDFRDDAYQLTWRQMDGPTGWVGPIRSQSTPDRLWVPRGICLLVRSDFGAVAEVLTGKQPATDKVTLNFRGDAARLSELFAPRAKAEPIRREFCVLEPYKLVRTRQQVERQLVPRTLLWFDPREGLTTAHVATNLPQPWEQRASIVGFEAVRLVTQSGYVRLRLVNSKTKGPVVSASVYANDQGFDKLTDADLIGSPSIDGVVVTRKPLRNLAFFRVRHGIATIDAPFAITNEVCDCKLELVVDAAANEKGDFRRSARLLFSDVQNLKTFLEQTGRDCHESFANKRYEESLRRAEEMLKNSQPQFENAKSRWIKLQETAAKLKIVNDSMLEVCRKELPNAEQQARDLASLRDSIRNAMELRNAQASADVELERAKTPLETGDIGQVIERYEDALSKQPDQPELRKKLAELKERWKIKSPAHQSARDFVYQRWKDSQVTEIEKLLPEVERHFETLKSVGDSYACRKLLSVNLEKVNDLTALLAHFEQREDEESKPEAQKYGDLVQQLLTLQTKVGEFVSSSSNAGAPASSDTVAPSPPGPGANSKPAPKPSAEEEEEPNRR